MLSQERYPVEGKVGINSLPALSRTHVGHDRLVAHARGEGVATFTIIPEVVAYTK